MQRTAIAVLVATLAAAACGDTGDTTTIPAPGTVAPTAAPPPLTLPPTTAPPPTTQPPTGPCAAFEDLAPGTVYVLGDTFTTNGIDASVGEFFVGGTPFDNFTEVATGGLAGGTGNELEVNNVTITFAMPASPAGWSVQFGEYGGEVNLAVNGANVGIDGPDFAHWTGQTLGPATVQASGGLDSADGVLELRGAGITDITIGGQELWIDNLCPLP